MFKPWLRRLTTLSILLLATAAAPPLFADAPALPSTASQPSAQPIPFEEETLPNGLRVLYAPLRNAPVVHVRVLYHVGSKDERPDRQGFAHMFEHMMFRGSAHVKPEEHMKLINMVGGNSNAFTSFDETVYVNTIPAQYTEMALYLEADRMASFKVSEDIYKVERNVVAKEWGIRQNQPYGTMFEDFLGRAFTTSGYRWTPIGNMEHLKRAPVNELQEFFNTYYVPDNAVLVVAGDIDIPKTKQWVHRYFAWIPKGGKIERRNGPEPEQTEPRRAEVPKVVPLPVVMIGWHTPDYRDPDQDALEVLAQVLGAGATSRLDMAMVNSAKPVAMAAGASNWQLDGPSVFTVNARLLPGKDPAEAEKMLRAAVETIIEKGVTADELEKIKQQVRVAIVRGRETCTEIATQLGDEALFTGDPNRVNTALERLARVTPADVQRVAKKYLTDQGTTTMLVIPDPTGSRQRALAAREAQSVTTAPVVPATKPIEARVVSFPEGYPTKPPMADARTGIEFAKGVESDVNGVKLIVMEDHRLPLVSWSLTLRRGGHSEPKGKEGLADLTASMLRRGVEGMNFEQLNTDLESRGIYVEASDGGDYTRVYGSSLSEQLDHGVDVTRKVLLQPTFPADEFEKLRQQAIAGLSASLANPSTAAGRDMNVELYGDSALGRNTTVESLQSLTLDDVKQYYQQTYRPNDAFLIVAGDVTRDQGQQVAKKLLDGFKSGPLVEVDYKLPQPAAKRKIILIDNPEGKQSVVEMDVRAYDIHTDEKYPGSVASQILSAGIESRLGKYVRAEKGYSYGVYGIFSPGRHAGVFSGSTETAFETTTPAIEAMWKVFDDMKNAPVTETELKEAKMRVNGSMAMGVQTIQQQANRRGDGILNGYPVDYYDKYPQRIAEVTPDQVQAVMNKYVDPSKMTIIVVAPADKVKEQLEKLGEVEVRPMPSQRGKAATQPSEDKEMLKKAA